ncbi:hypothetical protein CHA01nite_09000 [Chryseobacterium hagamense]|uniref:Uncharacterized protein n=1 Tax=Chryseobacterium hagamense TaxID=395935 RepID=A0A511YIY5_9FLAO|nr:hypothetical protein CHA01nite_09000 [Chryseobacterium hagamense]
MLKLITLRSCAKPNAKANRNTIENFNFIIFTLNQAKIKILSQSGTINPELSCYISFIEKKGRSELTDPESREVLN